jgi:hypothetical protein
MSHAMLPSFVTNLSAVLNEPSTLGFPLTSIHVFFGILAEAWCNICLQEVWQRANVDATHSGILAHSNDFWNLFLPKMLCNLMALLEG